MDKKGHTGKNRPREKALSIIRTLNRHGADAWIVGGAARDMLLGQSPKDYDIVTNLPLVDIRRIFKKRKVRIVGTHFQVCLVDDIEVATYRPGLSKKSAAPSTLKEDLGRRDLTINALAYNPLTNETVDFWGGVKDLENRTIRFTGDPEKRILEDPLRMIRACRFKSGLPGVFHEETMTAIRTHHLLVKTRVAVERIRLEVMKAMAGQRPSLFFESLLDTDLLPHIFPSMIPCIGCDGGPFHGETVWEHALLTGDAVSPKFPLLRLAAYLHDVGKPHSASMEKGWLTFIGHETKGADMIGHELARLKFSNEEIAHVVNLVRQHMRTIDGSSSPKSVRRFAKALMDGEVRVDDWLRLKMADRRANLKKEPYSMARIKGMIGNIRGALDTESHSGALHIKDLAVNGADVMAILGIPPGKQVGAVLEGLLDKVLDDPALNTRRQLMEMILDSRR